MNYASPGWWRLEISALQLVHHFLHGRPSHGLFSIHPFHYVFPSSPTTRRKLGTDSVRNTDGWRDRTAGLGICCDRETPPHQTGPCRPDVNHLAMCDLLHAEGGANTDGDVAQGVQHDPAAQLVGLQADGSGDGYTDRSEGGRTNIIPGTASGGRPTPTGYF